MHLCLTRILTNLQWNHILVQNTCEGQTFPWKEDLWLTIPSQLLSVVSSKTMFESLIQILFPCGASALALIALLRVV